MRLHQSTPNGFTLIELLVVVTIIVVLLALLVPAMDKAIYAAELAACGAHLRGIGTGGVQYAMENKRSYFHRPGVADYGTGSNGVGVYQSWRTTILRTDLQGSVPVYDDRSLFRDYIPLDMLKDPLTGDFDITQPDTQLVYAGYSIFFGWKYQNTWGGRPQAPMQKLGQKFSHYNEFVGGEDYRFDVLASDNAAITPYDGANGAIGSHPDKEQGITSLKTLDNEMDAAWSWAYSWWTAPDWRRGPVDMNFTRSDLSVERILDVKADRDTPDNDDPRVRLVSDYNQAGNRWHTPLPPTAR